MSVLLAHASIDENNKAKGGKAGDQTGKEVCTRSWYNKPWKVLIRAKDPTLAQRIAIYAQQGATNDNIGYDQNQRNTLWTQLTKNGYDISTVGACECDCSSFASVCARLAGANIDLSGNAPTTSSMESVFKKTNQFDIIKQTMYLNSSDYLRTGDILLAPGSHTVIVLNDGDKVVAPQVEYTQSMPLGMDTSKWQFSRVDYSAARKAGYSFVYLRIGCNGTKDSNFEVDWNRAISSGLKVGVYYAVSASAAAINTDKAKQFANQVVTWLNDREPDYPVAFDIEGAPYQGRKTQNSDIYNAFATVIKDHGYGCILYTGMALFNSSFDKDKIKDPLWIARYSTDNPEVGRQVAIWQYTSDAVPSDFYTSELDRDLMLIDEKDFIAQSKIKYSSVNTQAKTTYTPVSPRYFNGAAVGTYRVCTSGSSLRVRTGPGTQYGIITSVPNNTLVSFYGYYDVDSEGVAWMYVAINGTDITGYCSVKYLIHA